MVGGKKLSAAEAAIKKALEASQLQKGTVMVEKLAVSDIASGPTIYLAGEFKNPRPFQIPAGTSQTLVSVILSAGGVTDKADLCHVRVQRVASTNGIVEEVDVQRILNGGGLGSDVQLFNGDVVVIPTTAQNVFYLTGSVKRQGYMPLGPNDKLSVYAGILQNGGFSRFADLKKVYVLRATQDGTKARLPVNILAIQKGLQSDFPLQPNDIVVVPEKFWSW
jgi:protein involved in polysaccharide export with SLBB domain